MDLITIDITEVPQEALSPGDSVELIGPGQDLDQLAARAGTIGYEILTSLSRRMPRTYLPQTRLQGER